MTAIYFPLGGYGKIWPNRPAGVLASVSWVQEKFFTHHSDVVVTVGMAVVSPPQVLLGIGLTTTINTHVIV